ncbi:SGNH/GDSL hydrolase family protein [Caulobacter sp. NIBR2454]|uniref:SGNH/GDSL hydrolase family protein n=1 Tax=Caulobacter sp. NIBR2454 TaxID=3015996 RepID=UPI0022B6FCB1|nr:SGNH/GDSL hydrolase family protein [Caulobacter sp. NIBR2454]
MNIDRRSLIALTAAGFASAPAVSFAASPSAPRWVGAWASAQQIPEPHNALDPADMTDATVRQIVRLMIGGSKLRVRLSNRFGTEPLAFSAVHVARTVALGSAAIEPGSDRPLTFDGRPDLIIPAGAEYTSDPMDLAMPALSHLTITYHLPLAPKVQTSHPGSRTTSFTAKGARVGEADLPDAKRVAHWYQIAGIDVLAAPKAAAIAIIGDSITDGFGVTPDTHTRWPDRLAERLQASAATRHLSVLNHGIGGNRILNDGLGPNALARFDRDVLNQTGVKYAVILEGVNDLGTLTRDAPATPEQHDALVRRMIGAYRQMVERGRARGLKMIGATILPYGASPYYHPDARNEADRQAVNRWIRTPGNFDAVIDFDAIMRDPARPERLRADLDNDGLHPSLAGYRFMGDAVPLGLFR